VLSAYDTYHNEPGRTNGAEHLRHNDLVAYFCFEFGFHESLPIYSGGLGILAGDHCKAASDLRMPFVAVGLLFRQGYFLQTIDGEGTQHAIYRDSDFDDLPIDPGAAGGRHGTACPGRRCPRAQRRGQGLAGRVGHVTLYLLDTDLEANSAHDRDIAHRLYGGDRTTRIEQEIMLGIGGVRALVALGLQPTVWHINEGHAAFMILERIRHLTTQGIEISDRRRSGGGAHGVHHPHRGAGRARPLSART
jgi:starch phosphorylase